ncbi:MAG: protein kinase, partial [Myxococcota bacterium]
MAADALLGRRLDGYTLEARIGTGATGHVYRASHPDQPAAVAVKVLNEGVGRIRSLRRRFQREARALGALEHPHVVRTFGFGVVDDVVYIAMELLEGGTLEETLQERPLELEEVFAVMDPVLSGVASAHAQHIVHRDL